MSLPRTLYVPLAVVFGPLHSYVDPQLQWNQGLIKINQAGNAVMNVDHTEKISGRGRKSVRIHSDYKLNGGLMLMDSVHMPVRALPRSPFIVPLLTCTLSYNSRRDVAHGLRFGLTGRTGRKAERSEKISRLLAARNTVSDTRFGP
jgi:hypothetical protein